MPRWVGDYLAMDDLPEADCFITNPPFSLSAEIVKRARTHIRGPICILQSVQWQSTHCSAPSCRSHGMRSGSCSGLASSSLTMRCQDGRRSGALFCHRELVLT